MKAVSKDTNRSCSPEVESRLRETRELHPPPADLHDAIMNAVRDHDLKSPVVDRRVSAGFSQWLKWIAATASAAACLFVAFMLMHQHDSQQNLSPGSVGMAVAAAETPALRDDVTASLPAALSPLSDELTRVQTDLDRTKAFLLSSLP